ncbi:MAG: T9SS type A sorting domain-containing protein [Paludibacter sp.]|nr:T9SS type A sorting domain-containing protein [Paludibacter sp.]
MKKSITLWMLSYLFAIGLTGLKAQTSLNVKDKSGTQTSYVLSDLQKLTFSSGVMTVSKKNGSNSFFDLINVRNINFANITSVEEVTGFVDNNLVLYPNPAKEVLQVRFDSKADENVLIQILNIQGKVVSQQQLTSIDGRNTVEIRVGSYPHGLYLCRLQTGTKIESTKFIKD